MSIVKKSFQFGNYQVTLETGRIARQATCAVLVNMADTVVLVTVVAAKKMGEAQDFFPLTVNYQERSYAAGKIPGGFFKREGRPSENEVLISRLIDRPIRPLFPDDFFNEVQIIATVLSVNPEVNPDIVSLLGASAALAASGLPFKGPIGAARVGYQNETYMLNPSLSELEDSALDLVVAGTEKAVLMVESEAQELSEDIMLGAVVFGHQQMQVAITAIKEFAAEVGNSSWDWTPGKSNHELCESIASQFEKQIADAYQIKDKLERRNKLDEIREQAVSKFCVADIVPETTENQVKTVFELLESRTVRNRILHQGIRIDGRDTKTVRPIKIESNQLPRAHGTALFTRGETQALVVATLGTQRDAQIIDALEGEYKDTFMLHYNFPPYCVGEVGFVGSPKRREIGHGRLAKRGIQAVLPHIDDFPYVIRVVSEITESNGSSSMASVCGTSLALMDAGVPIKSHVAGIAMGLIKEGDAYAVITDILGDEDHLGDMDFKVAGTRFGITALQMDIKIDGITKEIMAVALDQAKQARLHILNIMETSLPQPKPLSDFAPRVMTIKIDKEKIRDVIGKGGAVIRSITEATGATIDISEEGLVQIYAVDKIAGEEAQKRIEDITAEIEIGKIYPGTVVKITDFGAFVSVLSGKEGLVHISQIANKHVENVNDELQVGQQVQVKVLEIDRQGRVRLSIKAVQEQVA